MFTISAKNRMVDLLSRRIKRQRFIKMGLVSSAGATLLLSCDDDDDNNVREEGDLGSGDTGVLNYAYALEQLESAFYTTVTSNAAFTSIFNAKEQALLSDIRDNEIIHREFYRTLLGGNAIPDIEPDFSTVNFTNRESVLNTAKTFEDTGVAAYNGAGQLLTDANLLLVAGKIVSVEGRHVAILRNMISPRTAAFAGDDVINPLGLERALLPYEVLPMVQPYIKTTLNGNNLPNT